MTGFKKRLASSALATAMTLTALPVSVFFISTGAAADGVPSGFAYTQGTRFMLDGSPFYYAGTNCYYLTFKPQEAVDNVFKDAEAMGLKVIRVWGNLDVGVKTGTTDTNGYQVFTNNNDGSGEKDGIYFQYFDKALGKPVTNFGEDGVKKLDYALYQAEKHGMKLLITFTNYWDAFGGMGQYVKWAQELGITGLKKDDFYTNETLKGWYKDYVNGLLNHTNPYTGRKLKDEPSVFAWELSNEPRCNSDAQCKDNILYNWAKEMSEYVKSIDPNHMVALGDEGFFNRPYGYFDEYTTSNYAFYGAEGVDFEKLMTIDTLDFGTPHLYLDQWGMKHTGTGQDDLLWFKIHGETCAELGKPVILEEFGLTNRTIRDSEYEQWFEVLEGNVYDTVEYAGTNYWMIASYIDGELYPDYDQYTVYGPEGTDTESTRQLIIKHAANMAAKNNVNTIVSDKLSFDRSDNNDLTVTATMKEGVISGITLDGNALTNGRDFTINNNSVMIKASYLKTLELKNHVFTLDCTAGSSPKFTVNVTDVSIPAPTLDKYIATVDKNLRHYKQVNVGYDKKTSEFRGITVNGKYLTAGTDYTDNGGSVTFSDSFIKSLGEGNVTLVFDFYEGADCEFLLTVTDTSTLEDIDTFESYTDDSQLSSAYTPNTSGNNVTVSLVDNANGKAMKFEYNVGSPNGYCGVNRTLSQRNVAQYKGVSITLTGDNSGNSFTLQFRDKNDNYFEKEITVNFSGEKTIEIPFEEFAAPSWQSGSAALDTAGIVQVAFYAGSGGSTDTGTYIIDDIYFYGEKQEAEGAHLIDKTGTFDGSAPATVLTKLVLNGQAISKITCGGKTLDSSTDYSWNGSQVTLNTPFTQTLANGKHEIVYHFSDGTTDTFTLTVKNSLTPDEHICKYVSKTVKPTTTSEGYTLHTCSICNKSYKDNFTPKLKTEIEAMTGLIFGSRDCESVSLRWDRQDNVSGYILEYLNGNKFDKLADKGSASSVSHKVTGLQSGKLYKFRVRAYVSSDGKRIYGGYSPVLCVRTLPKAMTNISVKAKTDNSITIEWSNNTTANGASVEIYSSGKWKTLALKPSGATSHTITGLKQATAYMIRVRAYINDENGRIYSVYNTTQTVTTALSAVENFRTVISARTALRFNWNRNTASDGYIVEMANGESWNTIDVLSGNRSIAVAKTGLTPDTAYAFRIRAYKTINGQTVYSDYSYLNTRTAK